MQCGRHTLSPLVKHLTAGDKILLVTLVVLTLSGFWLTHLLRDRGVYADIMVENRHVATLDLLQDRELTVQGQLGPVSIKIHDGKVSVISSPCRQKICEKTGPVFRAGDIIVCLPSKLVIQIRSKNSRNLDAVTG